MMPKLLRVFEEPVVIMFSWAIFLAGMMGAMKIIGARMPKEGILSGPGDVLRNV